MSLPRVRRAGAYVQATGVRVKRAGAYVGAQSIWRRAGGVWTKIWNALSAVLDEEFYNGFASTDGGIPGNAAFTAICTATPSAGTTYLWGWTGAPSTTSGQGTPNFTMRLIDNQAIEASGLIWCDVTNAGTTVRTAMSSWTLTVTTLEPF